MAQKVITPHGNAQLDTAQKEFGTASGLFDGASGTYIQTADNAAWDFGSGDFTIDFWFRAGSLTAQRFYGQNDGAGNLNVIGEFGTSGLVQFLSRTAGVDNADYRLTVGISTGVWTHMAIVRSGTSFFWFINGISQTLTVATAIGSNTLPNIAAVVTIGSDESGGTNYDGWLDEYRISKGIARWTSNFTPPVAPYTTDAYTALLLHMDGADASTSFFDDSGTLLEGLAGYWKLDEASGNVADSSGNSNTLVNTGVTLNVTGKILTAADFEASDTTDVLTILDISQTGLDITGSIAMNMWLKPESDPVNNGNEFSLLAKFDVDSQRSYLCRYSQISSELLLRFMVSADGSTQSVGAIAQNLGTGTFKMVTFSWNNTTSTVTIYVNGASIGTATTGAATAIFNGSSNFSLGNSIAGAYDGVQDEVGIWANQLTPTQVSQLYNSGAGLSYPFVAGLTNVKTWDGLAIASVSTVDSLAAASIKSINGVT